LKFKFKNEPIEANINELPHKNYIINHAFIVKWNREIAFCKRVKEDESWILATNQPVDSSAKTGNI